METIKINKYLIKIVQFYDSLNIEYGNYYRNKLVQWMNYREINTY